MNSVERLLKKYIDLKSSFPIDYEKFNMFSLIFNSCAIEGSTLNEQDTVRLLEEDFFSIGSSIEDCLMVKDHYDALLFVIEKAKEKVPITVSFIQEIESRVMKNTGTLYHPGGTLEFDETKGDLRKISVSSGYGGKSYMNPKSVPEAMKKLAYSVQENMNKAKTIMDQLLASFDAHFYFENIHPFTDGNGRTGRLLMTYIQLYFDLPPLIIRKELKDEYIQALIDSRNDRNDLTPIRDFLFRQFLYKNSRRN